MKKLICMILASAMFISSSAALAADKTWKTVSSWAYSFVSAFTNEGLLPESFNMVSDFTENINKTQLNELTASVLKTENINFNSSLSGDGVVTREDMANVLFEAGTMADESIFTRDDEGNFTDESDFISSFSAHKLCAAGIMSVDEDNKFNPKSNVTIEQAITAVYRLYLAMPQRGIRDISLNSGNTNETVVKVFFNGYYETKCGDKLYITDGLNKYMEFETDIYSNILCNVNEYGKYIIASRYDGTAEVYNMDDSKLLFTLPYEAIQSFNNYIFVSDSKSGSIKYGVYDFNNQQITDVVYTLDELTQMGYYDTSKALPEDETLDTNKFISDVPIYNSSDIEKSTWAGTSNSMWISSGNSVSGAQDELDSGVIVTGENTVAVLTDFNGIVRFEINWVGMAPEKLEEHEKLMNEESYDEGWAVYNDASSYTDLYRLELTDVKRRYGDRYGLEGIFRLTKNNDVVFDNAKGYLYNLPAVSYGDDTSLNVNFNINGKEFSLKAYIDFGSAKSDEEPVDYSLEHSISTKNIFGGHIDEAVIQGEKITADSTNYLSENEEAWESSQISYNSELGLATMFLIVLESENYTGYDISMSGKTNITDDSISGDFYVNSRYENNSCIDVFHGTITGINGKAGDYFEIKSDDNKYYFKVRIIEENIPKIHGAGTREVEEFITDEPYFVGTPYEQDQFDNQEHEEPYYRRIVVDDDGKVMYVCPIEWQQPPLVYMSPGEMYSGAESWQNLDGESMVKIDENGNRIEEKQKWLLWDSYKGVGLAVIPPEYQFIDENYYK